LGECVSIPTDSNTDNPDDFTTFLSGFSVYTIPNLCAMIIGIVFNAKKPHDDFYIVNQFSLSVPVIRLVDYLKIFQILMAVKNFVLEDSL